MPEHSARRRLTPETAARSRRRSHRRGCASGPVDLWLAPHVRARRVKVLSPVGGRVDRGAEGLSQEALAERAGVAARTIGAIEQGTSTSTAPYKDTVQCLADALAATHDERVAFMTVSRYRRPRSKGSLRNNFPLSPQRPSIGCRGGIE